MRAQAGSWGGGREGGAGGQEAPIPTGAHPHPAQPCAPTRGRDPAEGRRRVPFPTPARSGGRQAGMEGEEDGGRKRERGGGREGGRDAPGRRCLPRPALPRPAAAAAAHLSPQPPGSNCAPGRHGRREGRTGGGGGAGGGAGPRPRPRPPPRQGRAGGGSAAPALPPPPPPQRRSGGSGALLTSVPGGGREEAGPGARGRGKPWGSAPAAACGGFCRAPRGLRRASAVGRRREARIAGRGRGGLLDAPPGSAAAQSHSGQRWDGAKIPRFRQRGATGGL